MRGCAVLGTPWSEGPGAGRSREQFSSELNPPGLLPTSVSLLLSQQRHHSLSAPSFFSSRLTPAMGWTDGNAKCTT